MNPVYSPVQPGTPYGNPKNMAYPGYTAGTPYKVPPTQTNGAPPPYSPSPNPYQTAMYPIRSAYPQQNLYAQGAYYTQPMYAAQPHVIHHTTVVQPNSIPSAIYPAPVPAPRTNGVAMGMVAGTTMAMSAGYTAGTPYKVPPTQTNGAPPPYSPSPNPYQTAMYPIRSAYPQQNLYAQFSRDLLVESLELQLCPPTPLP
ncbi:Protein FAM168A [Acipenser ruthenus]|uniref:Protein FAM168A n=1 Tax=Acipenser ruthenus TaxID=7906 RepID=A0A662YPL6_ACIRT|nr:Protein FAM168A [Acipenser ruthenus]